MPDLFPDTTTLVLSYLIVRHHHLGVPDEKSAGLQTKAIQHTFDFLDQMLTDRP